MEYALIPLICISMARSYNHVLITALEGNTESCIVPAACNAEGIANWYHRYK